jgi:hypothetical protein
LSRRWLGWQSPRTTPISDLDESDLIDCADDELLCSEALALWGLIRKARVLAG